MKRVLCAAAIACLAVVVLDGDRASADLDNQVFTSSRYRVKLIVPRTWRVTEQPSYPGFLLWLMRSQPEGKIVVTGETFSRDLYCSWPVTCRNSGEPLASRYACAIRAKLISDGGAKMRVGVVQAGPKENEEAHFPSVWFEYADGGHFLRQAIAFAPDNRIISMVLATSTEDARRTHVRAFDQMLRSLASIDAGAAAGSGSGSSAPAVGSGSSVGAGSGTTPTAGSGAGSGSAGAGSGSSATVPPPIDNAPVFPPMPQESINPIGPCS